MQNDIKSTESTSKENTYMSLLKEHPYILVTLMSRTALPTNSPFDCDYTELMTIYDKSEPNPDTFKYTVRCKKDLPQECITETEDYIEYHYNKASVCIREITTEDIARGLELFEKNEPEHFTELVADIRNRQYEIPHKYAIRWMEYIIYGYIKYPYNVNINYKIVSTTHCDDNRRLSND